MQIEVKIPSVGESVREATLAQWFKKDGDHVTKDTPLFSIETDKVTLEVVAPMGGVMSTRIAEGDTVRIGTVACLLDTEGEPEEPEAAAPEAGPEAPAQIPPEGKSPEAEKAPGAKPAAAPPVPEEAPPEKPILSPAVRRLAVEKNIDPTLIRGTGPGGRVTKGDLILHLERTTAGAPEETPPPKTPAPAEAMGTPPAPEPAAEGPAATDEEVRKKPLSQIRKRIAQRLVAAKQQTAMLTTFNEVDMSRVMDMRSRFGEAFHETHGVRLGIMSFFIKACVAALDAFPELNAFFEEENIAYHRSVHMGVAVGSERGLVVPVIRRAEALSFAQIEKAIIDFVDKIKANQLALSDLQGGTFTITNGGVYGSLLSTPILNLPQSGILGLHKIEKRPVVIGDEIVVRPMMYTALSYDHRIVDGREAVQFLKRIKTDLENPERLMLEV
jgi:2-oxoglutarate dehydrogenase E2 component (dihydrolipoamide succinyltransferase)